MPTNVKLTEIYIIIKSLHRTNWIELDGLLFKSPCVVVIVIEDVPVFAEMLSILCTDSLIVFEVKIHKVKEYSYHLHSYVIPFKHNYDRWLVSHSKLVDIHPQGLYSSPNSSNNLKYIVMRNIIV